VNILLVSQCDKRALTETRRILDQFAERRGDRTWQTPITQAGLDTLRRLLRKTARKNTAVACHWIRGRDHSELLWIVGNASRFNLEGAVPTNTTARDVIRSDRENDWHTGQDIRLLAQLAALLHDLGKASVAFQQRLRGKLAERNLYRHEWVSLRLFQAFVGEGDDDTWLHRLADATLDDEQMWTDAGRYLRDGLDAESGRPFEQLPPLAAAIGWLVVTHHRLPLIPVFDDKGEQQRLGCRSHSFTPLWLEQPLSRVAHTWNERKCSAPREHIEPYWALADHLPVIQPKWRTQAARLARKLIALRHQRPEGWLSNPYVMHLARLSLMLADHHYSALAKDSPERISGDGKGTLFANTDRDRTLKQPLDEHLLGVAHGAGMIAHALPGFERDLPRIANHRGLRKRSGSGKFAWQDKVADAACGIREGSQAHGAFVVNMASTGCGKTLANARILYALADPQRGMRMTYALGLRTLTLQTGRSYRDDLHLDDDELAIRVGGSGSRDLFDYYQQQAEAQGSASIQALIEEDSHVLFDGNTVNHPLLSRALEDPSIRALLSAPVLVCTVDHIAPATEALRAGRQIAPMLRLMSSDLVLDELDDYDLDDLPALTRLVHWAGLLGTRVVLSSATLPPALVEGMFMAYRAGRIHYARNRGEDGGQNAERTEVACLWADEFGIQAAQCAEATAFAEQHKAFASRRATRLADAEPLRRGALLPLTLAARQQEQQHAEFAQQLREACLKLHADHAETCPVSGKHVSFGIVRMANIDPLVGVAQALYQLGAPEDTRIHLCVYHARFPLVQRSSIEHQLDTAFNRRRSEAVYHLPTIRSAIDGSPEKQHVFVVLASPVCEVGRDWDADWAIAEPSSLRSLIQLAGRVQRHRGKVAKAPNLLIFDANLRHFRYLGKDQPAFIRPGFEQSGQRLGHPFRLQSHRLGKLLQEAEYHVINANPRIHPRPQGDWQPAQRLADLEQARMQDCMLPKALDTDATSRRAAPRIEANAATVWQLPQAMLTGMLPQQQPFRDDPRPSVALAFLPDDDEERLLLHRVEEARSRHESTLFVPIDDSQRHDIELVIGPRITQWGEHELLQLLFDQAEHLDMPLRRCAERLATVEAPKNDRGWCYHPLLGIWATQ
jgi:CRISPR-associated endonuclease/helicase Cas3